MDESKCPVCGSKRVHEEGVTIRLAGEDGFKFLDTTITHCSDCDWWATAEVLALQAEIGRLDAIIEDAKLVIDAAWGGPCGEPLADVRSILGRG